MRVWGGGYPFFPLLNRSIQSACNLTRLSRKWRAVPLTQRAVCWEKRSVPGGCYETLKHSGNVQLPIKLSYTTQ